MLSGKPEVNLNVPLLNSGLHLGQFCSVSYGEVTIDDLAVLVNHIKM